MNAENKNYLQYLVEFQVNNCEPITYIRYVLVYIYICNMKRKKNIVLWVYGEKTGLMDNATAGSYVHVSLCVCVCGCVCAYMHVWFCTCTHACVCVCVCV